MNTEERRMRRALAACPDADQGAFRLTACYAAEKCQRDLGCPLLDTCWSADAEIARILYG